LPQGFRVESIAFLEAMGNIEVRGGTDQLQGLPQDRGPRRAIDIVVAVYADATALADRLQKAVRGLGNAR
jgi:hypothetical protein